jgi:exonuclease III
MNIKERQTFFDSSSAQKNSGIIKLLNWNISNPSIGRAHKQAEWLIRENFDIIVLTEVRVSKGCVFIRDRLESLGYDVLFPEVEGEEYGVLVASKLKLEGEPQLTTEFLPHRAMSGACRIADKSITITGLYVPPSGAGEKRKKFHEDFRKNVLGKKLKNWVILGDLNIPFPDRSALRGGNSLSDRIYLSFIEHGLVDAYRLLSQKKQDFSLHRKEKGYRPDNIFISQKLADSVSKCYFLHKKELSDHSAMYVEIRK